MEGVPLHSFLISVVPLLRLVLLRIANEPTAQLNYQLMQASAY
jgi:hypothetical protein